MEDRGEMKFFFVLQRLEAIKESVLNELFDMRKFFYNKYLTNGKCRHSWFLRNEITIDSYFSMCMDAFIDEWKVILEHSIPGWCGRCHHVSKKLLIWLTASDHVWDSGDGISQNVYWDTWGHEQTSESLEESTLVHHLLTRCHHLCWVLRGYQSLYQLLEGNAQWNMLKFHIILVQSANLIYTMI